MFKRCKSNNYIYYIYTHCEGSSQNWEWPTQYEDSTVILIINETHDHMISHVICGFVSQWTTKFMIIYGHQIRKIWCFRVFFFPSKCQITPDSARTVIFGKFHGPLWLILPGPGWWWNTPVDEGMRYLRYLWSVGVWGYLLTAPDLWIESATYHHHHLMSSQRTAVTQLCKLLWKNKLLPNPLVHY